MEHITIYFTHGIRDIIPYIDFVMMIKASLKVNELGTYLEDDMAIDGSDVDAYFSCPNVEKLFEFIKPELVKLPFMIGAKVTFTYGELNSGAIETVFYI